MSWRARTGLIAVGILLIFTSVMQMRSGHLVFANASYHQTTFAASGIGVGIVFILLAFLPPGEWIYRRISTRRPVRRSRHTGSES